MGVSINELAQGITNYFAAQFPFTPPAKPGDVVLVFDALGVPLQPGEFIGTGTSTAQDILSHQRAAQLADQVPAANALLNGWYIPRSGSQASRWYQHITESSNSTSLDDAEVRAFEALKFEARRILDQNKLALVSGSVIGGHGGTVAPIGTNDYYYSTGMSPTDWFLEGSTSWSTYSIASADQSGITQDTPLNTLDFKFRIADPLNLQMSRYMQEAVVSENAPIGVVADPTNDTGLIIDFSPVLNDALFVDNKSTFSTSSMNKSKTFRTFDPQIISKLLRNVSEDNTRITTINNSGELNSKAVQFLPKSMIGKQFAIDALPVREPGVIAIKPGIDFDVILNREKAADESSTKPLSSDNFSVSFEYCMVNFNRSWWHGPFVNSQGWGVPGYNPGHISAGKIEDGLGQLTLITNGMLVIRKLVIKAQWSAEDVKALDMAASLGSVCIAGGKFDATSGELRRDGMQAIAWVCEVPPILPPVRY